MGKNNKVKIPRVNVKSKVCILKPTQDDKVVWRFHRIDKNGKFAFDIARADFNHKLILGKILLYSTMTWQEIEHATHDSGKSKNHIVRNAQSEISREAWQRIEAMRLENEVDSLFSLAVTNLIRIWGLRLGNEFHVLWYDPKHEVFPAKNNR